MCSCQYGSALRKTWVIILLCYFEGWINYSRINWWCGGEKVGAEIYELCHDSNIASVSLNSCTNTIHSKNLDPRYFLKCTFSDIRRVMSKHLFLLFVLVLFLVYLSKIINIFAFPFFIFHKFWVSSFLFSINIHIHKIYGKIDTWWNLRAYIFCLGWWV